MNTIIPFKDMYDVVKSIKKYSKLVLYISTIINLITFIVNNITSNFLGMIDYVLKANCILIVGYIISSLVQDYLLFNARKKKRLDLIDNAFGSAMTTEQSIGYFTNENVKPGIYKLAVNGFENVHFSLNISKSMLLKTIIINSIILMIFLASAIYGLENFVVLIIQLTLPAIMLQQIIRLVLYVSFLDNLYLKYCSLFNDLKDYQIDYNKKLPEIVSNILEYESILSWANILLCEKKYNEMNIDLSKKWEEIKMKYKIGV